MLRSCDRQDLDPWRALQKMHGIEVGGVDVVHFARDQRVLARRVVEDDDLFEGVEIGQALLPVAVMAHVARAYPELQIGDAERATAIPRHRVDGAIRLGGQDRQVIVGHHEREVGIARRERDDHVHPVGPHVSDRRNQRSGSRGAVGSPVVVDRGDDIFGRQNMAGVEFDARADRERPGRRVCGGFPAFGQFRDQSAIGGNLGQVVVALMRLKDHEILFPRSGIQAVGGRAMGHAHP